MGTIKYSVARTVIIVHDNEVTISTMQPQIKQQVELP